MGSPVWTAAINTTWLLSVYFFLSLSPMFSEMELLPAFPLFPKLKFSREQNVSSSFFFSPQKAMTEVAV